MKKKIKKMLAAVSAMAICATSVISMGVGAIAVFKDREVRPETTSFSASMYEKDVKFHLWQKATDYFDDEDVKIYISDTLSDDYCKEYTYQMISTHVHYYDTIAEKWIDYCSVLLLGDGGRFAFDNNEDFINFKKYLSDNNIAYVLYESDENALYLTHDVNNDEYFDILQKIKDDTGLETIFMNPEALVQVTETENTLPEPTLLGDANEDGTVTIADAVLIMQALSNPDDFQLTPQGAANADIVGDGVTVADALRIQEMEINM
ncbi:MAG: dockerin type I repeat-containing protein [Alistipes senegalensis]|nr:dockerin type I repeat-containing protein [Alistipes senegalensis]